MKVANPSTHAIYCDMMFQEIKLRAAKRNLRHKQSTVSHSPCVFCHCPQELWKNPASALIFSILTTFCCFFSAAMLRLGGLKQICYKVLPVSLGGNDAFPTVSNYHCVEFQSVQLSIGGIWPIGLENEHEIVCPKSNGTSTPLDLSNCGLEISICCVTFKSSSLAAFPSNRGKLEVRRNVKQLRSWISKVNPF